MVTKSKIVLLPIHPQYVNLINSGEKKIEFRKQSFCKSIEKIVVYSTSPIKKIVGFFDVEDIEISSPQNLWKRYSSIGGIEQSDFFAYYKNHSKAVGIKIKEFIPLKTSVDLSVLNYCPPQSYMYLSEEDFKKICKIGR